jgi:hypothetical protein
MEDMISISKCNHFMFLAKIGPTNLGLLIAPVCQEFDGGDECLGFSTDC